MVGPAYNDRSIIQALELAQSPLSQAEENATKHVCQDKDLCGTKHPADDHTLLSFESQSDTFRIEDDKSILVCLASDSRVPVTTNSGDTLAAGTEILESCQCATKVKAAEKHSSPTPSVSTCDAMISTELVPCPSVFTQTEDLKAADKHINTEVYMADLDSLTKVSCEPKELSLITASAKIVFFFVFFNISGIYRTQESAGSQERAKRANKKVRARVSCSCFCSWLQLLIGNFFASIVFFLFPSVVSCKLRGECECVERVKQAELALLDLHYIVCKQHCWRLCYTSAEGNQLTLV